MSHAIVSGDRRIPARRSLKSNVIALYALQFANYGIPLLTLPYLIRALGAEAYGVMAIAHATVFFFVLAVDAGFNTRATRLLAQRDMNHDAVEQLVAATQWVKLIAAGISLALLLALIAIFPSIREHAGIYLVTFLTVIGSLAFPVWLFQGLELMHLTTVCSVTGRLIATAAIFALVRGPDDLLLAAFLQAAATAVSGVFAVRFILRKMHLRLRLPRGNVLEEMRCAARESRALWGSELSVNAMMNSSVFVLSFFASDAIVGVFAAIEKIFRAACSAFQPLLKALFPRVTNCWTCDAGGGNVVASIWTRRIVVLAAVLSASLVILATPSLRMLFGSEWAEYGYLLEILALALFLSVAAAATGQFWLLARGHTRAYAGAMFAGSIVQLAAGCIGAYLYGPVGLALAFSAAELVRIAGLNRALRRLKTEYHHENP